MPSNVFATQRSPTATPPYCKKPPVDLPPLIPPDGPVIVQGYGTLIDHDPLAFNDIAAYFKMGRVGTFWLWTETLDMGHCRFSLTLRRLSDPQPWDVTIAVPDPPLYAFSYTWPPFDMILKPLWDTGHLTMTWPPLYDKVTARITA